MATASHRSTSTARRSVGLLRVAYLTFSSRIVLAFSSCLIVLILCLHMAVKDMASRIKTVAGHNLEPTPWHPFPQMKQRLSHFTFIRCHVISCPSRPRILSEGETTQVLPGLLRENTERKQ